MRRPFSVPGSLNSRQESIRDERGWFDGSACRITGCKVSRAARAPGCMPRRRNASQPARLTVERDADAEAGGGGRRIDREQGGRGLRRQNLAHDDLVRGHAAPALTDQGSHRRHIAAAVEGDDADFRRPALAMTARRLPHDRLGRARPPIDIGPCLGDDPVEAQVRGMVGDLNSERQRRQPGCRVARLIRCGAGRMHGCRDPVPYSDHRSARSGAARRAGRGADVVILCDGGEAGQEQQRRGGQEAPGVSTAEKCLVDIRSLPSDLSPPGAGLQPREGRQGVCAPCAPGLRQPESRHPEMRRAVASNRVHTEPYALQRI